MTKNWMKTIVVGGITTAVIAALPAVGMARQHYTGKTQSVSLLPMMAVAPATHSKKSVVKLTSHKHLKKTAHTKTILFKHHRHTKLKKHAA